MSILSLFGNPVDVLKKYEDEFMSKNNTNIDSNN
jgi:hypothetical protein